MSRRRITFDNLTDTIVDSYSWRRKELKIVKDFIPNEKGPKQNASIRFAIPILYAHWEGFVKNVTEIYLEFVANKYLNHNQLKPQFIALSLSKHLAGAEIKNIEDKTKTIQFLTDQLDKKSNILTKNVIQTRSNLKFSVFTEILFLIGIEENDFLQYKSLIDDLVTFRNNIAHGEYMHIDLQAFENLYEQVEIVMNLLKTKIENSAVTESFKIA